MTDNEWNVFCNFKEELKIKIAEWQSNFPELQNLQKQAALKDGTPEYPFETTVVYNKDFEKIKKDDEIKLIVIGDNPGKDEQLEKNNRYLVGQAGKIGEGFFKRNAELNVDFRKNVIIVNKTPVHSAKTIQLKTMVKDGGLKIAELIKESQIWMARKTVELHMGINAQLWLVGYSQLKEKGIFEDYKNELKKMYEGSKKWEDVYVYQHFSMNCFTNDLKKFMSENKNLSLTESLKILGNRHKIEIFN